MAHKVSTIVKRLEKKLPEGPRDDLGVRSQVFKFSPKAWRDRWPETLDLPKTLRTEERHVEVSRQDVFDRARTVQTEGDAIDTYVLMAAWGTGVKARPVARAATPLAQPNAGQALLRYYLRVREGTAADAYRQLKRPGEDYVRGLGPSFFTKWLYFSAYDRWTQGQGLPPLILDTRVAAALGWEGSSWSASQYQEYLDTAEEIRGRWAPDATLHCIEHALFTLAGDNNVA